MEKTLNVKEMRLEDKIALCSGEDLWHTKAMPQYGIGPIMMADGPHGLRKQENSGDILGINRSVAATSFPTAVTTACSWDENLLREMGQAIAEEAAANQVSVVLGPGANIKRNPLCGRNFEYFSEDPYLTGKMAASWIRGAEEMGIGTSLKHFAMNNQEYKRFSSDSQADERTMREIYLAGFETAVKEGKPATVMCAYNKINGEYCSDNKKLLTDILRKDWGFDGMVVTDWGAMGDRIKGFQAGCDLAMPGGSSYMEKECLQAVKDGRLAEADIDRSVERVLRLTEQGNRTLRKWKAAEEEQVSCPEEKDAIDKEGMMRSHYELARKIAVESAVLLKNKDQILPLQSKEGVVFIGHMAKELRYQGAGSSHINPWRLTSVTDACPDIDFVEGCDANGDTTKEMLLQAREVAQAAKTAVLFVGLPDQYESEGFDREHMKMPKGHLRLIKTVTEVNPNTVVVLLCGSVVEVPWLSKVKALLYMGLPGEAGGEAIADLLFGRVNPSGRLAESWPKKYEDCVSSEYYGAFAGADGKQTYKDAQYREGIYVGYRYYETAGVKVRFPFGYGLSYTQFLYSDMKIEGDKASCIVTNTGNVTGKEVVQLYIEPQEDRAKNPGQTSEAAKGIYRAKRELKGFKKIELQPGESQSVCFTLDKRSFAVWQQGWKVPLESYLICIGKDSHHMVLSKTVKNVQDVLPGDISFISPKYLTENVPEWYCNPMGVPSQKVFEELLGRRILQKPLQKGKFTKENTVMEMKEHSLVMKLLYKVLEVMMAREFGGKADYNNPTFRMMVATSTDCSISGMKMNGRMNNYVLEGLLEMANGRYLKGIWVMFGKSLQ